MTATTNDATFTEKAKVLLDRPDAMRVAYVAQKREAGEQPVVFERFEIGIQIAAETGCLD